MCKMPIRRFAKLFFSIRLSVKFRHEQHIDNSQAPALCTNEIANRTLTKAKLRSTWRRRAREMKQTNRMNTERCGRYKLFVIKVRDDNTQFICTQVMILFIHFWRRLLLYQGKKGNQTIKTAEKKEAQKETGKKLNPNTRTYMSGNWNGWHIHEHGKSYPHTHTHTHRHRLFLYENPELGSLRTSPNSFVLLCSRAYGSASLPNMSHDENLWGIK